MGTRATARVSTPRPLHTRPYNDYENGAHGERQRSLYRRGGDPGGRPDHLTLLILDGILVSIVYWQIHQFVTVLVTISGRTYGNMLDRKAGPTCTDSS